MWRGEKPAPGKEFSEYEQRIRKSVLFPLRQPGDAVYLLSGYEVLHLAPSLGFSRKG